MQINLKKRNSDSFILRKEKAYVEIITDGSKVDEKVAAAAVSSVAPNSPFLCRQRDQCSIDIEELQAVLIAFQQAYQALMILPDSLSALQALEKI